MEITLHRKSINRDTSASPTLRDFMRPLFVVGRAFTTGLLGKIQTSSESALQVEEKLSLGPKKMLYLVRCREKEFLIAAGNDATMTIIEVLPEKNDRIAEPAGAPMRQAQKKEQVS
jgi:flagellar biogenesis protein FliO